MGPIDYVAIGVIVLLIGGAIAYIIKAKLSGKKCIGCPDSASCKSTKCSGSCAGCSERCSCHEEKADE